MIEKELAEKYNWFDRIKGEIERKWFLTERKWFLTEFGWFKTFLDLCKLRK